jgi:hypothetical protein
MTLKKEVMEIVKNARADYYKGAITFDQYLDVTRIPLKDLCAVQIARQKRKKGKKKK